LTEHQRELIDSAINKLVSDGQYPSCARILKLSGVSLRQIKRRKKELKRLGAIKAPKGPVVRRPGASDLWMHYQFMAMQGAPILPERNILAEHIEKYYPDAYPVRSCLDITGYRGAAQRLGLTW
jgi:hypothetical protein